MINHTFGETLYALMKAKNITIDKLCRKMNMKSKTTIARILKDQSSFKSIQAFYTNLMRTNPIHLTEYEKQQLAEAFEVNKIGKDNYLANKELMYFINGKENILNLLCVTSFGHIPLQIKTLCDLFRTYSLYKKVRICIVNSAFDRLIKDLSECLDFKGSNIHAEHFISYEQNKPISVKNFVTVLPILNKPNYNAYQAYFSEYNSNEKLNRYSNVVFVLKMNDDDEYFTDIISFKNEREFTVLYNQEGADIYNFHSEIINDMIIHHNPIKSKSNEENLIDGLINISSILLDLERSWEQILIKSHFCFNSIRPEMLLSLLQDHTIPEDKSTALFNLHTLRYENYKNRSKRHIGIYTKPGIIDFINTGFLSDHIPLFRAFTKEEALATIQCMIEITQNNPANEIYLLKNDINYNQYQYLLYGSDLLFFCDNHTDYNNMNFSYIINSSIPVNAFYDFVKNELIVNHCYSASESIGIIKDIIESC